MFFFYRCAVHFSAIIVHSPTDALFIKFEKSLKFTLKFTLSLLQHVSVYDHHQGAYVRAWLNLYQKSVNVKSLHAMRRCGSMLPFI